MNASAPVMPPSVGKSGMDEGRIVDKRTRGGDRQNAQQSMRASRTGLPTGSSRRNSLSGKPSVTLSPGRARIIISPIHKQ
jgi:hypothetical protein